MAGLLSKIWNWALGNQEVPELPLNIFFERDVTADNDFLVKSIFFYKDIHN